MKRQYVRRISDRKAGFICQDPNGEAREGEIIVSFKGKFHSKELEGEVYPEGDFKKITPMDLTYFERRKFGEQFVDF